MNARLFRLVWASLLAMSVGACQHPQPSPPRTAGPTAAAVEGQTITGNLSAIDPVTGTVTIKLLWKGRVFTVAPDCEIITGTSRHAKLTDLRVGDPVEATYVPGGQPPLLRRLAVRGVTKEERSQAREHDRLEKILTPDPSERPAY